MAAVLSDRIESHTGSPAQSFIQDIVVDITNVVEAPTTLLVGGGSGFSLTENQTPIADFGGIVASGGDLGFYMFSLVSTAADGNTNPDAATLAQLFAITRLQS